MVADGSGAEIGIMGILEGSEKVFGGMFGPVTPSFMRDRPIVLKNPSPARKPFGYSSIRLQRR